MDLFGRPVESSPEDLRAIDEYLKMKDKLEKMSCWDGNADTSIKSALQKKKINKEQSGRYHAIRIASNKARHETTPLKSVLDHVGRVDEASLPRDVILSNQHTYRITKLLGKGGMGAVYGATRIAPHSAGGEVALKICDPNASLKRAEREADILQELTKLDHHQNIVKFVDSALDGSLLVIVMELVKGKPLDAWLDEKDSKGNRVTLHQTKPIVQQLVDGMAFVHSHNIAHRDLKPSNLMYDEENEKLIIVDFGLSKQLGIERSSTITQADAQLGTMLYMSPEQHNSDMKAISFPSDVWAIGIIWHELLTSFTPFELRGKSAKRSKTRSMTNCSMTELFKQGPRELPMLELLVDSVPEAITGIIAKCLNSDTYDRHRDATELSRHIKNVYQTMVSGGSAPVASTENTPTYTAAGLLKLIKEVKQENLAANELLEIEEYSAQEVAEVKAKGEARIEAYKKNKL